MSSHQGVTLHDGRKSTLVQNVQTRDTPVDRTKIETSLMLCLSLLSLEISEQGQESEEVPQGPVRSVLSGLSNCSEDR